MQMNGIAGLQISESVIPYRVGQLPSKAGTVENPLAVRLKTRRDERGLTQVEFAEKLGMKVSQYNRYEKGADPSTELLAKMATILGCTTDYLLGLVQEPMEYLEEHHLPADEKALLGTYRRYKIGNRITKVEQRILRDLAPDEPETPLIEAPKNARASGNKE